MEGVEDSPREDKLSAIHDWLVQFGLTQIEDKLVNELDFDDLDILRAVADQDINEIIEACGLKHGKKVKFRLAMKHLKTPPVNSIAQENPNDDDRPNTRESTVRTNNEERKGDSDTDVYRSRTKKKLQVTRGTVVVTSRSASPYRGRKKKKSRRGRRSWSDDDDSDDSDDDDHRGGRRRNKGRYTTKSTAHYSGQVINIDGGTLMKGVNFAGRDVNITKTTTTNVTNTNIETKMIIPRSYWGCEEDSDEEWTDREPKPAAEQIQSILLDMDDRPRGEMAYEGLDLGDAKEPDERMGEEEGSELLRPVQVICSDQETDATQANKLFLSDEHQEYKQMIPATDANMIGIDTQHREFIKNARTNTVAVANQLNVGNCASHSGISAILNAVNRLYQGPPLPLPSYLELLKLVNVESGLQTHVVNKLIERYQLPMTVEVQKEAPSGKDILTKNVLLSIYSTKDAFTRLGAGAKLFPSEPGSRDAFLEKYPNISAWGERVEENENESKQQVVECQGHGVLVESYNFLTERFRCKNSWGPKGSNGRFEIDPNKAPAHCRWVIVSVNEDANEAAVAEYDPPPGSASEATESGWFHCNEIRATYDDSLICRKLTVPLDPSRPFLAMNLDQWIGLVNTLRGLRKRGNRSGADEIRAKLLIGDEESRARENVRARHVRHERLIEKLQLRGVVVKEEGGQVVVMIGRSGRAPLADIQEDRPKRRG